MKALATYRARRPSINDILIVFISDGRFLETFGDDADRVARLLELPIRDYAGTRVVGFPLEVAARRVRLLALAGFPVVILDE
jgi:DNA mismatch repair ATPase MutS